MKTLSRQFFVALAASFPLVAFGAYPDKPIRMVVPYSAGGGADTAARVLAQRLSDTLGKPVIVDNRPGAGGVIGADAVAKAAPDGYTVLYDASAFAVNPAFRKLSFDPVKDLVPISLVVTAANILVVPPSAPYKTVAQFIDYGKGNPDKLTYASAGAGTASHLAGEMLSAQSKVELRHIPYKGGAPALTDVIGGQVSSYFGNIASTRNYVTSGKLRALAVTSRKRSAALPDTPTMIESGYPDFEVLEWNGVFVPKGTPDEIVQKLAKEVQAAVANREVNDKLVQLGLEPVGGTPAEFGKFIQTEMARWGNLVKTRNIKVE